MTKANYKKAVQARHGKSVRCTVSVDATYPGSRYTTRRFTITVDDNIFVCRASSSLKAWAMAIDYLPSIRRS